MSHQSDLIATDIDAYLAQHERKELLRFLTCGSVDDGKSTLISRLLYDSKMIYEDQLATIQKDSVVHGTTGGDFDPALLTDGLKAEREQGITIDVAYRYFSTAKRKFIIADTPGHVQYTRNMATGASTCDLAIILIDARHGVIEQTKRHSFITSLLGIRHIMVAVNKMDLVDYDQARYDEICDAYKEFAQRLDRTDLHFIPISALLGDNVVDKSENMPWYDGSTLMHFLEETLYIGSDRNLEDFRMPVQYVNRPHLDFRGFCGTIGSGIVRKGDDIVVLPSGKTSKVKSIVTFDGELEEAFAPLSVTLTFEDEIDASRGDMIARPGNVPRVEQHFEAMVVWMDETAMVPGKQYIIKHSTLATPGIINTLRYQIDVNTLHRKDAPTLGLNEIGRCAISLNQPIMFDAYRRNRSTGAFIVVDRLSNATVAAGMIMDRTGELHVDHWEHEPTSASLQESTSNVTADERKARFGQSPATILLTGLTGSGKTDIARALERRLFDEGRAAIVLDGQNMRLGVSRDLGFSSEDRSENLRRSAEVAHLVNDSGMICIGAFVAPEASVREKVRQVIGEDRYVEVYLSASIEYCRANDSTGMYEKADAGEIRNFPGVSSDYDVPENPHLVVETDKHTISEAVDQIVAMLKQRQVIL
ncbi:MAG: sulfate adenylyltransferase subunit CysN [Pirellulales bacterium]|nr:sulfate adenylyltransferase subunit CysN [Pirellulales bacterium]